MSLSEIHSNPETAQCSQEAVPEDSEQSLTLFSKENWGHQKDGAGWKGRSLGFGEFSANQLYCKKQKNLKTNY